MQVQLERLSELQAHEAAVAAKEGAVRERELDTHALCEQLAARAAALDAREAAVDSRVKAVLGDAEARLARVLAEEEQLLSDKVRLRVWRSAGGNASGRFCCTCMHGVKAADICGHARDVPAPCLGWTGEHCTVCPTVRTSWPLLRWASSCGPYHDALHLAASHHMQACHSKPPIITSASLQRLALQNVDQNELHRLECAVTTLRCPPVLAALLLASHASHARVCACHSLCVLQEALQRQADDLKQRAVALTAHDADIHTASAAVRAAEADVRAERERLERRDADVTTRLGEATAAQAAAVAAREAADGERLAGLARSEELGSRGAEVAAREAAVALREAEVSELASELDAARIGAEAAVAEAHALRSRAAADMALLEVRARPLSQLL
jgi:hypothetical protein